LKSSIPDKPIQSPLKITESVLKRFCPSLLPIEALSDRVPFHLVILNPACTNDKQQDMPDISASRLKQMVKTKAHYPFTAQDADKLDVLQSCFMDCQGNYTLKAYL
jgi:hypothetical protein